MGDNSQLSVSSFKPIVDLMLTEYVLCINLILQVYYCNHNDKSPAHDNGPLNQIQRWEVMKYTYFITILKFSDIAEISDI